MSSEKVNNQNMFGQTPLMVAIEVGAIEKIELFIQNPELDVNIKDNEGKTALMYAAIKGNHNIFKLILKRKEVDVNLQDDEGKTALMYAIGAEQNWNQQETG